jgi:putative transposase
MPEYRRAQIYGGCYFFTLVTFDRAPILTLESSRQILRDAWSDTQHRFPFTTEAVCLLPEHLHCIWRLPETETNFSVRWKEIKRLFTRAYLQQVGSGEERNDSRIKQGEAAIWQRRFWEHTIRDEEDFNRHLDYIHYNPVKHGLVKNVADWPWSSFHRYVRLGFYDPDWGGENADEFEKMSFGE